jgi:formylglycine-generating enzyme required for sulfatase activity
METKQGNCHRYLLNSRIYLFPRVLVLLPLVLTLAVSGAEEPNWDGCETIAQYARRRGLEPTKTLDLGDTVFLEMVLIPAGTFVIGTPNPPEPDTAGIAAAIQSGKIALGGSVVASGILLTFLLSRIVRYRQRPQYSLLWLLALTIAAGIGVLGYCHWYFYQQELDRLRAEYKAMLEEEKNCVYERPAHEVTISTPYYIGKTEVTQQQYLAVMGTSPSCFLKEANLPVEQVSWDDAQEFCSRVSKSTIFRVRLPSEAEWEFACRAGTERESFAGNTATIVDRVAWYEMNSGGRTHPVGTKEPNAWGVHDMQGNVLEWCADFYGEYIAGPRINPQGPEQGEFRVLRGGSWRDIGWFCRAAVRTRRLAGVRYSNIGFRIVATAVVGTPSVPGQRPAPPSDSK